ncbi:MAG: hypothetical protein QMD23_01675 [Candidatus Bathyarchaeia archaeon]|nr:hypothetical protein [Candidatus Bathyarchaeia archaeon]
MKKQKVLAFQLLLFLFTLINSVNAAEESFVDQFLGSPLVVLVAIIVIDIIAFIYHKVRR